MKYKPSFSFQLHSKRMFFRSKAISLVCSLGHHNCLAVKRSWVRVLPGWDFSKSENNEVKSTKALQCICNCLNRNTPAGFEPPIFWYKYEREGHCAAPIPEASFLIQLLGAKCHPRGEVGPQGWTLSPSCEVSLFEASSCLNSRVVTPEGERRG
jgi:hypothetical protein